VTNYRYTFLSLRNDEVIDEIDLSGVYAQRLLNTAGAFTGTFYLDSTGKSNEDLVNATIPGKTWVVMERDDVPVWWGVVWSRTYQSQAKVVTMFCQGFEAFPGSQKLLTDYVATDVDQVQLFTDLWNHMQSSAVGRNLGISIPSGGGSSVTKSVNVLSTDDKYYIDIMSALSDAADGFDWTVRVTKDPVSGKFNKDLVVGYPIIGATVSPDSLAFEYPGAILNYFKTESMKDAATHTFGLGAGEGQTQLRAVYGFDDLVTYSQWPRWDEIVSMKDVDDQTQLQGLTQQEAIRRKPPMIHYTVTLKGNVEPIFGSYGLGDNGILAIKDPMHPAGIQIGTRIVGWELHPASSQQTEEVNLILPGDEINGQVPTAAQ